MQNSPIKKVSKSQSSKNSALAKIKSSLDPVCIICGSPGFDLAHLLPKGLYPEYYTLKENVVIMCRRCHDQYDNNRSFRSKQIKLKNIVLKYDELAAERYFSNNVK